MLDEEWITFRLKLYLPLWCRYKMLNNLLTYQNVKRRYISFNIGFWNVLPNKKRFLNQCEEADTALNAISPALDFISGFKNVRWRMTMRKCRILKCWNSRQANLAKDFKIFVENQNHFGIRSPPRRSRPSWRRRTSHRSRSRARTTRWRRPPPRLFL